METNASIATPKPAISRAATHLMRSHWHRIAVGALLLTLVVQNTNQTRIDFLWLDFTSPLWVILLAASAAGFVLAVTRRRRGGAHR